MRGADYTGTSKPRQALRASRIVNTRLRPAIARFHPRQASIGGQKRLAAADRHRSSEKRCCGRHWPPGQSKPVLCRLPLEAGERPACQFPECAYCRAGDGLDQWPQEGKMCTAEYQGIGTGIQARAEHCFATNCASCFTVQIARLDRLDPAGASRSDDLVILAYAARSAPPSGHYPGCRCRQHAYDTAFGVRRRRPDRRFDADNRQR